MSWPLGGTSGSDHSRWQRQFGSNVRVGWKDGMYGHAGKEEVEE